MYDSIVSPGCYSLTSTVPQRHTPENGPAHYASMTCCLKYPQQLPENTSPVMVDILARGSIKQAPERVWMTRRGSFFPRQTNRSSEFSPFPTGPAICFHLKLPLDPSPYRPHTGQLSGAVWCNKPLLSGAVWRNKVLIIGTYAAKVSNMAAGPAECLVHRTVLEIKQKKGERTKQNKKDLRRHHLWSVNARGKVWGEETGVVRGRVVYEVRGQGLR